jgi:hypothetical protein
MKWTLHRRGGPQTPRGVRAASRPWYVSHALEIPVSLEFHGEAQRVPKAVADVTLAKVRWIRAEKG